jgi:hypothetical protein
MGGGGKQAEKKTVPSSGSDTEPELDEKEVGGLPNSGRESASDSSSGEEKLHNALVRKKQKLQLNKELLEIAQADLIKLRAEKATQVQLHTANKKRYRT